MRFEKVVTASIFLSQLSTTLKIMHNHLDAFVGSVN